MSAPGDRQAEMRAEWSRLQACWQSVREGWSDEVAARFERDRWREWETVVPRYINALEELEHVAREALRER